MKPPRLTQLPRRIAALPRRVTAGQPDIAPRADRERTPGAWRAWYKTKRWRELRLAVFERDGYKCQRSGVLCIGRYPDADSPTANHRKPHRGDPALFWDIDNIETVTKEVHDGLIQREEQGSLHERGRWD